MTYEQAIEYIESKKAVETSLGLHRMRALMAALGDPQRQYQCVHVAGTNGKGSACAMAESILRAAGYRTGLATSPHLLRFNERIRIGGVPVSDERLAQAADMVRRIDEAMDEPAGWFEIITAITLKIFALEGVEAAVLEVGLGGEFDATNVIDTPACALIMNIGLDHTAMLGNTLGEIASAKAGIIKPGGDVVAYRGEPEVEAVFEKAAAGCGAVLHMAPFDSIVPRSESIDGQVFDAGGYKDLFLPLAGPHQQRNAAVVVSAMEILRARGWHISPEAVRRGLAGVEWPARFEVVRRSPVCIVDGGHNPQCLDSAVEALQRLLPGRRVIFVTGILGDKDVPEMVDRLRAAGSEYITVTPRSARAMEADELAAVIRAHGGQAESGGDIAEGIALALSRAGQDDVVCCIGSLYLAGEARQLLRGG